MQASPQVGDVDLAALPPTWPFRSLVSLVPGAANDRPIQLHTSPDLLTKQTPPRLGPLSPFTASTCDVKIYSLIMRTIFTISALLSTVLGLPTVQIPLLRHADSNKAVSPDLFAELEELARIVDISYCINPVSSGISKPFKCASRCDDFPTFELVKVSLPQDGPHSTDNHSHGAPDSSCQTLAVMSLYRMAQQRNASLSHSEAPTRSLTPSPTCRPCRKNTFHTPMESQKTTSYRSVTTARYILASFSHGT